MSSPKTQQLLICSELSSSFTEGLRLVQFQTQSEAEAIFTEDGHAVEEFLFFLQSVGKMQLLHSMQKNHHEIVNYLKVFYSTCEDSEQSQYIKNILSDESEIEIFFLEIGDYLRSIHK